MSDSDYTWPDEYSCSICGPGDPVPQHPDAITKAEAAIRQRVETAALLAYQQGYEDRAHERDYDPGRHR